MSLTATELYNLLPAIYRSRDTENGLPLQALLQVIAGQSAILEDNIQQLYDDEFIETCARWVIPYIGDLVGASPIYEIDAATQSRRAEVANTIGYRRRKGTLLALEQVAMDVSGLPVVAVEFFKRVITTESMRLVRPKHAANLNLRHGSQLARVAGPFDHSNRTIDVRRIAHRMQPVPSPDTTPLAVALHGAGKYNVPDVGIYLWRWKSYPVFNAPAFRVDAQRFLFSPLGQNMQLFNFPPPRASFSGLTTRLDVPQPITRREFFDDPAAFYGANMQLIADGTPIGVSQLCIRDLSDQAATQWGCTSKGKIAIDPELGRIEFASDLAAPRSLRVNYCYGFPADLGGGPYDRSPNLPVYSPTAFHFLATVGSPATPTLEDAIVKWNLQSPGVVGMIVVPNFESYKIHLTGVGAINMPAGSSLWIVSAQPSAPPIFSNARVLLRGDIEMHGSGQLFVNGVWLSGSVHVRDAGSVQFSDCTLVPGIALSCDGSPVHPGEPSIVAPTPGAAVSLLRAISGPLAIASGSTTRVCSSIVDAGSRCSVACAAADLTSEGADLHVEDSTIVGKIHVRTMELASNTIFVARRAKFDPWKAAIWCGRKQSGCVRFCFVPADSITPKRYRCLPADPSQEPALRPQFITFRYGDPSYALLSGDVPMAIWTGADNGSQMGVYHSLEETEALRNVQLRVPEFLPFNLEAGLFLEPSAVLLAPLPAFTSGYTGKIGFNPCGDSPDDELSHIAVGAHLI
jgi:hypothetical protein